MPAPPPPPMEKATPKRPAQALPQPPPPSRLLPFLERLGRARLLRDRRTVDQLREELPTVYESDASWICSKLEGELFVAAGAAEFARLFGLRDAVPPLGSAP